MIHNIQVLRAFAATIVVLLHLFPCAQKYGYSVRYLDFLEGWGHGGVDLFFVISGFIILHTHERHPRSAAAFLRGRVLRIQPIYVLLSLAFYALFVHAPQMFQQAQPTPTHLLSSLVFASRYMGFEYPVIYVGWTLEYEVVFYLAFALAICSRWRPLPLACLAGLTAYAIFDRNLMIFEFALGMLVYILHRQPWTRPWAWPLLGSGLVLFIAGGQVTGVHRFFTLGLPAGLVLLGAIQVPQVKHRLLVYLGDASYSIYLLQVFTTSGCYKVMRGLGIDAPGDVVLVAVLVLSVLGGCLFYTLVEQPLTRWLRRRLAW